MSKVVLWGSLKTATGGKTEFDFPGTATIKDILDRLAAEYPGLRQHFDRGLSVSIDGTIYREALFKEVGDGNEVYLLPRMAGG